MIDWYIETRIALSNIRNTLRQRYVTIRRRFSKCVQRAKRVHWHEMQNQLLFKHKRSPNAFWKEIGRLGARNNTSQSIPMEVVLDDGSISNAPDAVLSKWADAYTGLLNPESCNNNNNNTDHIVNAFLLNDTGVDNVDNTPMLNTPITLYEVAEAVGLAHNSKAPGFDNIPVEVLKNPVMVSALHDMFSYCFTEGVILSSWSKTVICPIPKSSTKDKRNPLESRGISLIPSICKVYCSILNKRLSKWVENEHILSDCQNGFRRGRSTIDHLTSLPTIIECRKAQRKSTFAAFIDLRKAYDSIRRPMLWYKLRLSGVNGKLYNSIRALYADTTACIRLNNVHSEWFNVNSGLKQGCAMSPLLFNLYINDLCDDINSTELGVSIGEEKVNMLMYADDLVLLGENENDLQSLLDVLYKWCDNWNVQVNCYSF